MHRAIAALAALAAVALLPVVFGCASPEKKGKAAPESEEADIHYTMAYADGWQRPVPPEAISPFEPKEVTYVDEPVIELDSDWNMDVKLFSKYRYTIS